MITVFTGSDRAKISGEVKKILGEDYEVFDGENLKIEDIVNIFCGTSLFADERKILLKDLTPARGENTVDFYEEILKYAEETRHKIVIWETNVSLKKSYKDFIKLKNVEVKKLERKDEADARAIFDIYNVAQNDGEKAVKMLSEIKTKNDPYMFFGLMASQAIKKFEWRQGRKERKVLKELSKLDMQMKSTTLEPWILIEAFLLRVANM